MMRCMTRDSTPRPLPQIKPAALRTVHNALEHWYAAYGRRDLPWRNTSDAYHIWVSEVMLQQTQVKTVLERYYAPFIARFPTPKALAEAPRDALMKAWEGLGYYSRANNLQKAAQQLAALDYTLPNDVEGLLALSGIGQNTAHAILAFAFHQPVAVMEANVKRVLCRVFALSEAHAPTLWALAGAMVNRTQPFDYNQAMMDVGATLCTKRKPRCTECPLASMCKGKHAPEQYPQAVAKKQTPVRERVIVAWGNGAGAYHLTQRGGKFLHGLYGFDEYDTAPLGVSLIGEVEQVYSHFTLKAAVAMGTNAGLNDGAYVTLSDIAALPLSRADAKVLKLLEAYEGLLGSTARKKK